MLFRSDDIKGMKIRPAHATMATLVTQLGGTNVQAGAPEVRDLIERGVADAVSFPWGSVPLFGIDKARGGDIDENRIGSDDLKQIRTTVAAFLKDRS